MPTNTSTVTDQLDEFMAARRAQDVSQSSDEDSGSDIDAFMKARRPASRSATESAPKTPIIPFSAAIPRTPPTTAGSQVGQPMVRLTPPPMETAQAGTISPAPQTVGRRVARALGSGAPQGSELANLTGEMGTPGADIGPR